MTNKRQKRKKKPSRLLDIVIPVRSRFDLLGKCIESIYSSDTNFEFNIILIDNDSPDKNEAREFYTGLRSNPDIIVKQNRENLGFPKACNQGAGKGRSPIILFLNSDVILDKYCLEFLVRELDNPEIGVVGARLLYPEDVGDLRADIRPAGKIQHVGLSCDIRGRIKHPMTGWTADHRRVMQVKDTFAVTGACLMTHRNLYRAVGGFDEDFGLGTYEDVSFCMSIRALGKRIVVQPKAWGYHYTGASAESLNQGFPLNDNELVFAQKWRSAFAYTDFLFY